MSKIGLKFQRTPISTYYREIRNDYDLSLTLRVLELEIYPNDLHKPLSTT